MSAKNVQKKIVLTGGPCAGKTTIAEVLSRAYAGDIVVVPEAASTLFNGGFPRWPERESRAALQRSVYRVQNELEVVYRAHHPNQLQVLDRGTVDGAAYWPDGPDAFFQTMQTSLEAELGRYHQVIYLESAGEEAYLIHGKRNPNRTETWAEARHLDELTRALWEKHPAMTVIPNQRAFSEKISAVLRIVEQAMTA